MLSEFLKAVFFIFAAEMGDKTQILAMTLATRFRLSHVILGIFLGAALNHGFAVAAGAMLGTVIPLSILQVIGGAAFLGFGLWTLKLDEDEDEESLKIRFHPIYTVAITFFIGELGDKTQLTAISLAMESASPFITLCGTVTGMMLTSAIGIVLGRKLGNRLSENRIKLFSFLVFTAFGVLKLASAEAGALLGTAGYVGTVVLWLGLAVWLGKPRYEAWKVGEELPLERSAERLHKKLDRIHAITEELCLGETVCGTCLGGQCQLGYIRGLVRRARTGEAGVSEPLPEDLIRRGLNPEKTLQAYLEVADACRLESEVPMELHSIRQLLEDMVLGVRLPYAGWERYVAAVDLNDSHVAGLLKRLEDTVHEH